MTDGSEYLRTVVRVFPDYAGTVLWFVDGPVSYAEAHLTPELESAMTVWESDWSAAIDDDFEWRSPEIAATIATRGEALARQLSIELGDVFGVEFTRNGDGEKVVVRGDRPGANEAAIAALAALLRADDDERERIRGILDARQEPRWTASGGSATFDPKSHL